MPARDARGALLERELLVLERVTYYRLIGELVQIESVFSAGLTRFAVCCR